jgi:site-specific DNA recombinase
MVKRAAIYCRISDDREGRRLGVRRQREDCSVLAAALGYTVTEDDIYIENDTGASSRSKKPRPEFDKMMGLARSNHYDAVIAYSSSRLTRRPLENELLIDLYEKHRVLIHYANTNDNDLSTARGRRRARDDAARDAEEVEELAERVSRTALQRAEEGRENGGTRPYGWSAEDRTRLDPREHAVIVEMADRALAGESLRSIAADLNTRGIPTVKGAAWSSTAIKGILTNPRLVARRIYKGEDVGAASWEPALPRATFDRLHLLLTDPARGVRRTGRVEGPGEGPETPETVLLHGLRPVPDTGTDRRDGGGRGRRIPAHLGPGTGAGHGPGGDPQDRDAAAEDPRRPDGVRCR